MKVWNRRVIVGGMIAIALLGCFGDSAILPSDIRFAAPNQSTAEAFISRIQYNQGKWSARTIKTVIIRMNKLLNIPIVQAQQCGNPPCDGTDTIVAGYCFNGIGQCLKRVCYQSSNYPWKTKCVDQPPHYTQCIDPNTYQVIGQCEYESDVACSH